MCQSSPRHATTQQNILHMWKCWGQCCQWERLVVKLCYMQQACHYTSGAVVGHQVMPDSLWPHGLQHTRLLCPPLSPGVFSDSCPLSWWCSLTISFSAAPSPFAGIKHFSVHGWSSQPHLCLFPLVEVKNDFKIEGIVSLGLPSWVSW